MTWEEHGAFCAGCGQYTRSKIHGQYELPCTYLAKDMDKIRDNIDKINNVINNMDLTGKEKEMMREWYGSYLM
jgi:hypothetical protein